MHIHSVIVSYKRHELTRRTLEAYLDTVSVSHSFVIVDNGSPPETVAWLNTLDVPILLLDRNYFPGYATNRGWEKMPTETVLLHRIDNDIKLLPGWCEDAIECFKDPLVGQYGLLAAGDREWLEKTGFMPAWPCGGNSIIHRKLYERGLRYSERPWTLGGTLEDTKMTQDVIGRGYKRVFSTVPVMDYMSGNIPDPEYDLEIRKSRGL